MPSKTRSATNEMVNYYQHIPKKFLNNVPNPQYNQHFIKTLLTGNPYNVLQISGVSKKTILSAWEIFGPEKTNKR